MVLCLHPEEVTYMITYRIHSDLESFPLENKDRRATSLDEVIADFQSTINSAHNLFYTSDVAYALHLFVEDKRFMTVGETGFAESV